MYSENQKRASASRANDAFLRRMVGGSLKRGELPVMNIENNFENGVELNQNFASQTSNPPISFRNGSDIGRLGLSQDNGVSDIKLRKSEGVSNGKPKCDGSIENPYGGECPTHVHAPSLAMVYAPRQCWKNLLDPASALDNGSLFAELILPLEVGTAKAGSDHMDWRGRK